MKHFSKLAFASVALALSAAANATPTFDFKYVDTIKTASTPGISAGETVTVNVFANNGGSSIDNQAFNGSNIQGFTIDAGTYHASYSTVYPGFSLMTNGAGAIASITFYGTATTSKNVDNYGSWTGDSVFGDFSFRDFNHHLNTTSSGTFNNEGQWKVSEVPEPTSIALMGLGLAGLGFASRKKQPAA